MCAKKLDKKKKGVVKSTKPVKKAVVKTVAKKAVKKVTKVAVKPAAKKTAKKVVKVKPMAKGVAKSTAKVKKEEIAKIKKPNAKPEKKVKKAVVQKESSAKLSKVSAKPSKVNEKEAKHKKGIVTSVKAEAKKKKPSKKEYDDEEEDLDDDIEAAEEEDDDEEEGEEEKDNYYDTEDGDTDEEPEIPVKKGKKGKKGKETKDDEEDLAAGFEADDIPVEEEVEEEVIVKVTKPTKKAKKGYKRQVEEKVFFENHPAIAPNSGYKKFEMEFPFHSSLGVLFEFLIEPTALQEWFADKVIERNSIYTFYWQGSVQQAKLLKEKVEMLVRYRWLDFPEDTFFEFRILEDEITRDTSLIIIDYAEDDDEIVASRLLWQSQVDDLHRVLGAR